MADIVMTYTHLGDGEKRRMGGVEGCVFVKINM